MYNTASARYVFVCSWLFSGRQHLLPCVPAVEALAVASYFPFSTLWCVIFCHLDVAFQILCSLWRIEQQSRRGVSRSSFDHTSYCCPILLFVSPSVCVNSPWLHARFATTAGGEECTASGWYAMLLLLAPIFVLNPVSDLCVHGLGKISIAQRA